MQVVSSREPRPEMLNIPGYKMKCSKNPEGFWLIAVSWESFRDWKADEGASRELLKDLQNLSKKSRNFNPPALLRPGQVRG